MAGLGRKVFTPGEVLRAADVNGYLMDQAVMNFAGTAARGSAIGTATDGMVSYLQDTNTVEQYRVYTNTGGTAVGAWEALSYGSGNKIINGDFSINQRAFSSTTTTNIYGFDRWQTVIAGDGTTTYSAQTFTPGAAPVVGYEAQNFARLVTTGQSTAAVVSELRQLVEDVRTFAGQTVTVSFWAKAASGTPKVALEFEQNFGSGGSPSSAVQTYAGQVTLSTSWARYALTVALPSISGKTIGSTANSSFLSVGFWTSAGSSFASRTGTLGIQSATIDFWGVQVESGSTANEFRRNAGSIAGELAACQRYYEVIVQPSSVTPTGFINNSTSAYIHLPFKVTKRASAAVTYVGTLSGIAALWTGGGNTATAFSAPNGIDQTYAVITTSSGLSGGQAIMFTTSSAVSIVASAEL